MLNPPDLSGEPQKLHYQQELLHYCELQHQRDQYGKNEKASGIFRNLRP